MTFVVSDWPSSPAYFKPSLMVATVWPPTEMRSTEVPAKLLALVPAWIVTGEPDSVLSSIDPLEPLIATAEPSVPFAVTEPLAPLTATEEPLAPFSVIEPSVPVVPAALSAALPKVMLSASFTS